MCGVSGLWHPAAGLMEPDLRRLATQMADALRHRGPDDAGAWVDEQAGLALGHRRLAIVDLSPAGHQPMASANGRYVIGFNGEIYNHLELRATLEAAGAAPTWRGHSDTETLLAAFAHWGVETTLQSCVGMFAIALWDRETRTLSLARDRLGEKPLYYGWVGGAFVFGSELKAFQALPGFASSICRAGLVQYLRFCYVPAPRSIYQDLFKIEPGCLLSVVGSPPTQPPAQPLRPGDGHGALRVTRWWALNNLVDAGAEAPLHDEGEALTCLETSLVEAVRLQSLADVPLGAFLSGGVDSSTIVALLQQQVSRPIQTFTIGFHDAGFDEIPHAREVAKHLGTEHVEISVSAKLAQDVIPTLPWMYDEPFADSSQIPTHLVSQAARQNVTVTLSGDAGDELFGGYNRYFWGPNAWNKVAWLPPVVRNAIGYGMTGMPPVMWNRLSMLGQDKASGVLRLGEKMYKLGCALQDARNMEDLYRNLVSTWTQPASLVRGADGGSVLEPPSSLNDPLPAHGVDEAPLRMMFLDAMTYLPDDILCKVDRAAMACSLETRVPFLDHRVVELAWRLPLHMKIRGNVGKWALRQILYKYVPKELIERPKAGFAVPIGQWLRGPLREWAEELLTEHRLQNEGYFYHAPIRQAWTEHLKGQRDHAHKLWAVLMFQAWLQEQSRPQSFAARIK